MVTHKISFINKRKNYSHKEVRRHKACANEVLNKNLDQEIEIRRIQALLKKEKSKDQ